MISSFYLLGTVLLTVFVRRWLLWLGEQKNNEELYQRLAALLTAVSLLGGVTLAKYADFKQFQGSVGTTQQEQGITPSQLVNCAGIALILGLLIAVLFVFSKARNTSYKKAKLSLSQPVTRGKLIAAPPSVRLDHIARVDAEPQREENDLFE